jgi:hypothetical protein
MAAAVALDLIQRGEVRDQWLMPSALPKMSIGTLTCHLGRQVVRAAELLPVATDVLPLESVDAHYHRAAWVMSTSPDDRRTIAAPTRRKRRLARRPSPARAPRH